MTTVQLRAELFHEMNPLLDNEVAMKKVLEFVRGLMLVNVRQASIEKNPRKGWADAAKQAHADGQDKLMMDEVFADEKMEGWEW